MLFTLTVLKSKYLRGLSLFLIPVLLIFSQDLSMASEMGDQEITRAVETDLLLNLYVKRFMAGRLAVMMI